LLKFVNLNGVGGFFSSNGEDVFIYSLLFNHLLGNSNSRVIEINKPVEFPYSLTTVFVAASSCSGVLINTREQLLLSYSKELLEFHPLPMVIEQLSYDMLGCLNLYRNTSKLYKFSSNHELLGTGRFGRDAYSLAILTFEAESLVLLDELLGETKIYALMILGNDTGFLAHGDMDIRNKLALKGYIYFARQNFRDDIFVLSELINGFPSKLFECMDTVMLQRWVSCPPNSDYSKPS
jgi:hypothetical protein